MIKFVPGKGWVLPDAGGSGMMTVIDSPEDLARRAAYEERQRQWRSDIGDYSNYAEGTIQDLAALAKGDSWWYSRLHQMANEVGAGDDSWFIREFLGRGNRDQAKEMVNRFLALQQQGFTDEEIMRGIYGENWGRLNPNWMDTTTIDQAPSFEDRYGPASVSSASVDGTKDPRPSDWKPTDQQGDMGKAPIDGTRDPRPSDWKPTNQQGDMGKQPANNLDAFMRALADFFGVQQQQQQPQSQRPVTRGLFGKYINKGQQQ